MTDSYFLYKYKSTDKQFNFKAFGCCETSGSWFKSITVPDDETSNDDFIVLELISINEIKNEALKDPIIIEEYLLLISEFLDIPIKKINNPAVSDISNPHYKFSSISEEEWNQNYLCFQIGKFMSNKHFVAMHTLIRYLWYEYDNVINASVNLRRLFPEIPIEDVFAIAHSFQERNHRALTGKNQLDTLGFIYFRKKKEYLKELKKDINFNTVFDSYNVVIIPKVKIKGSFFEDSEILLESKQFISFLTDSGSDNTIVSRRAFHRVIEIYNEYKSLFEYISTLKLKNLSLHHITTCDIIVEDSALEKIEFETINHVSGIRSTSKFTSIEKFKEYLTNKV